MHHRASLLSRLALALLAALGFVAPLDRPEPARTAQVTGKALAPEQASERRVASARLEPLPPPFEPELLAPRPSDPPSARRYLLHRAWLL